MLLPAACPVCCGEEKVAQTCPQGRIFPLNHDLGESQADIGSADFVESNISFSGKYFVLDFPYNNCGYLQLHYGKNMECLL